MFRSRLKIGFVTRILLTNTIRELLSENNKTLFGNERCSHFSNFFCCVMRGEWCLHLLEHSSRFNFFLDDCQRMQGIFHFSVCYVLGNTKTCFIHASFILVSDVLPHPLCKDRTKSFLFFSSSFLGVLELKYCIYKIWVFQYTHKGACMWLKCLPNDFPFFLLLLNEKVKNRVSARGDLIFEME